MCLFDCLFGGNRNDCRCACERREHDRCRACERRNDNCGCACERRQRCNCCDCNERPQHGCCERDRFCNRPIKTCCCVVMPRNCGRAMGLHGDCDRD